MTHLLLEDKVTPTYAPDEPLRLRLWVRVDEPADNVQARITLRTDADVGLGTAWSESFALEHVGMRQMTLNMPLDLLAKGTFYASIGLYRVDELGRKLTLDHISRAFKIELLGTPIWNTDAHGYVTPPCIGVRMAVA